MKSKYSSEEKFQIVMESFTDNVTQAEICRRHGIYPVQLSKWREQFILGGKSALAQRRNSDSRDEEINYIPVNLRAMIQLKIWKNYVIR